MIGVFKKGTSMTTTTETTEKNCIDCANLKTKNNRVKCCIPKNVDFIGVVGNDSISMARKKTSEYRFAKACVDFSSMDD